MVNWKENHDKLTKHVKFLFTENKCFSKPMIMDEVKRYLEK